LGRVQGGQVVLGDCDFEMVEAEPLLPDCQGLLQRVFGFIEPALAKEQGPQDGEVPSHPGRVRLAGSCAQLQGVAGVGPRVRS
jgi:hypothetical protein